MSMQRMGVLAALALVACEQADQSFAQRSEVWVEARGAAINETGDWALVGMYDTTCLVDAHYASIGADFDAQPEDDETVHDLRDFTTSQGEGRSSILVTSASRAFVIDPDDYTPNSAAQVAGIANPRAVAFVGDDIVAVEAMNGCEVAWSSKSGVALTALDEAVCEGSPALVGDADGQRAFIVHAGGVLGVVRGEAPAVLSESGGDLIAWDEDAELLLVAESGGTHVRAFDPAGAAIWSADVNGPITAIAALHDAGRFLVSIRDDLRNGSGILSVLEGGEEIAIQGTPEPATQLGVSADGSTLLLTVPQAVHFFDVAL